MSVGKEWSMRNWIAVHAFNRKAGVHDKTIKAKRRKEKMLLAKETKRLDILSKYDIFIEDIQPRRRECIHISE